MTETAPRKPSDARGSLAGINLTVAEHARFGVEPARLFRDYAADTLAERLAHEAPTALVDVLCRAEEAALHTENLLELEAPSDQRTRELHERARQLRRDITAHVVEVGTEVVRLG